MKIYPQVLTFSIKPRIWLFLLVVLLTTAKKWTKLKNARAGRAKLLFLPSKYAVVFAKAPYSLATGAEWERTLGTSFLPHAKRLLVPMNFFLWWVDNGVGEKIGHKTHIDFLRLLLVGRHDFPISK